MPLGSLCLVSFATRSISAMRVASGCFHHSISGRVLNNSTSRPVIPPADICPRVSSMMRADSASPATRAASLDSAAAVRNAARSIGDAAAATSGFSGVRPNLRPSFVGSANKLPSATSAANRGAENSPPCDMLINWPAVEPATLTPTLAAAGRKAARAASLDMLPKGAVNPLMPPNEGFSASALGTKPPR